MNKRMMRALEEARRILKEAEAIDVPVPKDRPKKSYAEQKSDDIYEAYLMSFDAMTKINESIRKLVETYDLLVEYERDENVEKILRVIDKAISEDLSPAIDRFSILTRAVKKIVFG